MKKIIRGQMSIGIVVSGLVGLLFLSIFMPIALGIYEGTSGTIDRSAWSNASNATYTLIITGINNAFALAANAPQLQGAALVIGMLAGFVGVISMFRGAQV